uniref:Uncharacterized protein n=1 Tax=Molossus molossus TaxID=27622 RepID=A0A7J8I0Y9_MOLMO|nr:hypothetical protein HJG59_010823 [Molossus molossus]
MVLVLAFRRRKQEPIKPTKQRKIPQRKNILCLFYILVYKPSVFSKMISFFIKKKKKMWKKIAIYMRSLAQGVKFTDFFNEKKHTKESYLRCFFTSAPCSCVSLRDFVKLIVGAFFYFFNKNELEKKYDINCQPGEGDSPVSSRRPAPASARQEPAWPSFGQTLKTFIKTER